MNRWPHPTYLRPRPPPPLRGCDGGRSGKRPLFGWHAWRQRAWNGNEPAVLPFVTSHHGIARRGYRCFHCGRMAWDETDLEFAAGLAKARYGIDARELIAAAISSEDQPSEAEGTEAAAHPGMNP